jgi:Winged helix DNA-binding domain
MGRDYATVTTEVLSPRALGRATLARQLLLERAEMPPRDAVAHLVGLQAQVPRDPYVALWSRLKGFEPGRLGRLLEDREVVRTVVMRATIHLVTADDCLLLRPLTQPVLDAELARHPEYAPRLRGVDLAAVMAAARPVLAERPRTGPELRAALGERFPDVDPAALAYACRCLLALVQVPPRGVWGRTAQVTTTTAEAWLGRPLRSDGSIDEVVLRYLAAFGPAATADVAAWSRLTGFRAVIDRLRPGLRAFRDERGRELLDLPDAPRPDPETPAPPRFLPEYDNLLLSHADRTRFVPEDDRGRLSAAPGRVAGSVLHDGTALGTWWIDRPEAGEGAVLVVRRLRRPAAAERAAVEAEGHALLEFLEPGTGPRDVRFDPVP